MDEVENLVVETCWITPKPSLFYFNEGCINMEFRNNSDLTIKINEVICKFQTEENIQQEEKPHTQKKVYIEPKNRAMVQIPFTVDLNMILYTNTYSLIVNYQIGRSKEIHSISIRPAQNSIIVYSSRQSKKYFFISHKIPEDTNIAGRLDHYLQKIGFKGFLAENNPKPGLDIWKEKILPSIDCPECIGVIAIWSLKAILNPDAIMRELEYGQECGKKQILLVENGAELPIPFPSNTEYQRSLIDIFSESDLINLVNSIDKMYLEGFF